MVDNKQEFQTPASGPRPASAYYSQRGTDIKTRFTVYCVANKGLLVHAHQVVAGIVDQENAYLHSSSRNNLDRNDYVQVIDFGVQEGFIAR